MIVGVLKKRDTLHLELCYLTIETLIEYSMHGTSKEMRYLYDITLLEKSPCLNSAFTNVNF